MSENLHLAVKIAQLYYDSGLTQDDIAQKLRLSRPKVSRLLQEARDAGLVKITVAEMPGLHTELENRLEQKYGLLDVLAVDVAAAGSTKNLASESGTADTDTYENTARELGAAAAAYLRRTVQDGDTIGLTWGLTLSAMVDNLTPEKKKQITITQLVGGMGEPAAETHATDLVRRMAMSLGANLQLIPAPGIVKSIELANMLRSEPYVAQALEQINRVNLAFVGIGALVHNSLLMRDERIVTWEEVRPIMERGAVGDIGLHFYDKQGQIIVSDIEERLIGAGAQVYRGIERVVGVAGGSGKYDSILGGIRGKLVNALITDVETAQRLLEEEG